MNNALGHIKSYISLIRCFVCCFKFPCPSCGEIFVFVSDLYLYRHCVVFCCCCIEFHCPSCGEVFVIVSSLYLYRHCVVLLLYQILPSFPQWGICICIKFVFVSTLCCFLLLYQIPPPFLRWGMTWGGAKALFVRLGAASDSEYCTLFDMNKMYLNISKWCKSLLWFDWFASQRKKGDNQITFLLLYGFVKKGVLLNNTYWTLNNGIPQPYLTRLCFVYWTSVIHFFTVEPQLCSHSIQSVHLRLNSHCLSNQYWPSTSYWPANSFLITARQA